MCGPLREGYRVERCVWVIGRGPQSRMVCVGYWERATEQNGGCGLVGKGYRAERWVWVSGKGLQRRRVCVG